MAWYFSAVLLEFFRKERNMTFDPSNEKHVAALLSVLITLVFLVIVVEAVRGAQSAPNTNLALRIIEYKNDANDASKQNTMKVVYDHRRIMNLDRNVTDLQTKLGSAGWVPVNDGFAKADVVPSGCVIRVLVSEKEQSTSSPSKYALEGCDPSMTVSSVLSPPHIAKNLFGYNGNYWLITQSR
jgi:hypothetical protein